MQTYHIEVAETLARVIEIKAESAEEARDKIRAQYLNGDIVLDAEDFVMDSDQINDVTESFTE